MFRRRTLVTILGALLVGAVVVLVGLALKHRALVERYEAVHHAATEAYAGMYVPVHEAVPLTGDAASLGRPGAGHTQLLYFLTTTCPYCKASLPAWKAPARDAERTSRVITFGVVLDSVQRARLYAREHSLRFPIVVLDDPRAQTLYRANRVPVTMVLSAEGRLLYTHTGELTRSALDSVRDMLDVPGTPRIGSRVAEPSRARSTSVKHYANSQPRSP